MTKKIIVKNVLYFLGFTFLLFSSYLLGLLFYDTTSGLDYGKYFLNVKFFMGEQVQLQDGNGSLYFYLISQSVSTAIFGLEQENIDIYINNAIQSVNFILYIMGLLGLYKVFNRKGIKNSDLFLGLSILSFLPTGFYFRLTMKPEIMAFALLPWLIYFLDDYFRQKTLFNKTITVLLLSILLTLKGSITGMTLLILLLLYRKKISKNKHSKLLLFYTTVVSSIFVSINYLITNFFFFSNNSSDLSNPDRWNNTASVRFFTKIDFKNLLENPYQYIHSDSLFSITLIDTLADYFQFFWQHEEKSNYISFNRVEFSNNFLIQTYLPQYISIIFTISFYLFAFIAVYKKVENSEFLIMPLFGLLVLIINSLGFPNKNFDPNTGDLFKVHYYSFIFAISFFTLTIILSKHLNSKKVTLMFFIPLFLLSMGFPKNISKETEVALYEKLNISELCFLVEYLDKVNCS